MRAAPRKGQADLAGTPNVGDRLAATTKDCFEAESSVGEERCCRSGRYLSIADFPQVG